MLNLLSLDELAAHVPHGARLAIAKEETGAAMAATRALVRRGVRRLHLVCVPVSGLQADVLIGAGCVATIETSAVSLGEWGAAPRFTAALRAGSLRIIDGTCPAIYAGLQAAQKGIPFMPLRGLIGSDLLAHRSDWKIIENPFGPQPVADARGAEDAAAGPANAAAGHDCLVAIQAIIPDVALFHARAADRQGNIFIGRERDGLLLAHASRSTLVTVEEVVEGDLLQDPARAGAVLPAHYVEAVALAPRGAAPLSFGDSHAADGASLARYAEAACSEQGFNAWLRAWLQARPGEPVAAG